MVAASKIEFTFIRIMYADRWMVACYPKGMEMYFVHSN